MFTYNLYCDFIDDDSNCWDYFFVAFYGIFTLILDIFFSPVEIIATILYVIRRRRTKINGQK